MFFGGGIERKKLWIPEHLWNQERTGQGEGELQTIYTNKLKLTIFNYQQMYSETHMHALRSARDFTIHTEPICYQIFAHFGFKYNMYRIEVLDKVVQGGGVSVCVLAVKPNSTKNKNLRKSEFNDIITANDNEFK